MTTGTFTRDQTLYRVFTILESGSTGSIRSGVLDVKTWTGGDSQKLKLEPVGRNVVKTTYDPVTGKKLRRVYLRTVPKRAGLMDLNFYTMTSSQFRCGALQTVGRYQQPGFSNTQTIENYSISVDAPVLPALPVFGPNDDIKLINQLKKRTRGSDFNPMIFLAEGRESFKMIIESATKIAKSLSLLKKGNVIGAINELSKSRAIAAQSAKRVPKWMQSRNVRYRSGRQSSDAWLELQFGWLPLLSDMVSGAQLLADRLNVPFRQRVVARQTVKVSGLGGGFYSSPDSYAASSKQIVAYFSEPESIPKLLGLTDPLSVVWEITPFSFLLDYAIGIGSWLEARGFASSLSGRFVTTTFNRQVCRGVGGNTFPWGDGGTGVSSVSGGESYSCSIASMNRTIASSLDVPLPRFKPLAEIASWKHCANALALLVGAIPTKLA